MLRVSAAKTGALPIGSTTTNSTTKAGVRNSSTSTSESADLSIPGWIAHNRQSKPNHGMRHVTQRPRRRLDTGQHHARLAWHRRQAGRQPEKLLELYEFEGCPFCRLVREALTELDIDALIKPCPKGGKRYRKEVEEVGGKQQFPFLVDPNTGDELYESADIIAHLYRTYADRAPPRAAFAGGLGLLGSQLATAVRGVAGVRRREGRAPEQPLELFCFESSPYSRLVRERLCELELPFIQRSTGKAQRADMGPPWVRRRFFPDAPVKGRNREALHERAGRLQVPYLIDPNTGEEMFESDAILDYLDDHYGQAA